MPLPIYHKKNVQQFYQLLSGRLKAKAKHYSALITRRDKKLIMGEAEKMVKTDPSFTREDKNDLKSVVDTIRQKQRSQLLRANSNQGETNSAINFPTTNNNLKSPGLESLPIANFPALVHKKIPNKDIPLNMPETEVETEQPGAPAEKPISSTPETNNKIPQATEAKDLPID